MFAYLDDATLDAVRDAAIQIGVATDQGIRDSMIRLDPRFVGIAAVGGNALAKLDNLLLKMNSTRVLTSGQVPMELWLKTVIVSSGGGEEELVFRRALERTSIDGAAPAIAVAPPPGGDTHALPGVNGQLEVAIGEDDTLLVEFLHDGAIAARSVAKLLVHRHIDGVPRFIAGNQPEYAKGTGWLIAPGLLITNHHVVAARAPTEVAASEADFALQGAAIDVFFDYYCEPPPDPLRSVRCEAADADLDFAVLRLADTTRPPLRLRTNPIRRPREQILKERVNVLQHPDGQPMRLGFRNNFVVTGTADQLTYLTDTAGGSSGSPICDDAWFVAALHRGFQTIAGSPLMVWGVPVRQENHGTPIDKVLSFLQDQRAGLHAEILDGQAAAGG